MKQKPVKKRKRIEGQIANEANAGSLEAALDIARSGYKCTPLQRAAREYLRARRLSSANYAPLLLAPERLNTLPNEFKNGNTMRVMLMACRACQCFLSALDTRDINGLMNLANEIKRFKTAAAKTSLNDDLVLFKSFKSLRSPSGNALWTVKEIAKLVGYNGALSPIYGKLKAFGIPYKVKSKIAA